MAQFLVTVGILGKRYALPNARMTARSITTISRHTVEVAVARPARTRTARGKAAAAQPRRPRHEGEHAVTAPRPAGADPARAAILAAVDWLLTGIPLRSSGRLSISQLAVEADVNRWHLTHQHLGLKELFQARVKALDSTPEAFRRTLSEHEKLRKKYAELRQHCADLEERLQVYAAALNLLTLENAALTGRDAGAHVIPLRRQPGTNERGRPDPAGAG